MSYCEHCEQEYPGLTCPVCGQAMLQEVDPASMPADEGTWSFGVHHPDDLPWPLGPKGEPEEAVSLTVCADSPAYGDLTIARLAAAGIPAMTSYPKTGAIGKLYTGVSASGVELRVPASMLAEAKKLLLPPENP